MKKILLTLFMALTLTAAQAQRIHAYVAAGTVTSQIEGDELKGFSHWNATGAVGAIAQLDNRDRWSLYVETGYACRGVYNQRRSSQNYYNIKLDLHYVDIPLMVSFHDPYGGMRVGLGFVYSRLLGQPHGTVDYRPEYFIPDSSDMSFLKNDIAPAIEFRFDLWKRLQFSARYQYSLIPVKKDWKFTQIERGEENTWYNDCYNSSLMFRLLWLFGDDGSYSHKKKRR